MAADYVIVGAGSAGCVLAGRLTEDPDVDVLLLEAGGPDTAPELRVPAMFPIGCARHDSDRSGARRRTQSMRSTT